MSTENNQTWGRMPIGICTVLLIVFLVWFLADGRPLFRHSGHDVRDTVRDAGHDLKSTGRDVADSIRRDVQ